MRAGSLTQETDDPAMNVVDLRMQRIHRAREAARLAGYRITAPPDAEADQWLYCVEVGYDDDGSPVQESVWLPRKATEDWQYARFGPFSPLEERQRAMDRQNGCKEDAGTPDSAKPIPDGD